MGAAVLIIGALFIAAILIGCVEQGVSAIRRRRKQQFKALVRQRNELRRKIAGEQKKHVAALLLHAKVDRMICDFLAPETILKIKKQVAKGTPESWRYMVASRDEFIAESSPEVRDAVLSHLNICRATNALPGDGYWGKCAVMWLMGDYAERRLGVPTIQARWDRRRMERNTAPALGTSRRQGRL